MTGVNHVFTVFALFAFTSASVPLTWHLTEASSWNAGTCLFIFWSGLSSLVWFVNSIVWDGNVVNWTPAWCDVCEFPFRFSLSLFLASSFLFCFACSGEDGTLRGSSACHAATRVAIATVVGIPASMLVIQRRLYFMVRRSSSNETTAQVRSSCFAEWGEGSPPTLV